ncbi:hypothetical protein Q3G72_005034 [Acer saccharum]|nr:hypothetical protein Q3G72_005034 [Acer saccharum]
MPRHKKYEGVGEKATTFTKKIWLDHEDAKSVKSTRLKLTWLPKTSELVNLTLVGFDYLITKKKLEEGDNFINVLNPCTRFESAALGDSNMRNLKPGEVLQLERKGYFICDVPFTTLSKPILLFAIPDGRQQAVLK